MSRESGNLPLISSLSVEVSESDADESTALVSGRRRLQVSSTSEREGSSVEGPSPSQCHSLQDKCNRQYANVSPEYCELVYRALINIDSSPPKLITGGSSGSYFIFNELKEIIGVFKPEDEEPYGINNPKWGKWFQKIFLPCSFGRGCLVPNQKGSLQTFLHGYMDAEDFFQLATTNPLTAEEKEIMTVEFQKMFVLDYIIRNTDRKNANFLVRVSNVNEKEGVRKESTTHTLETIDENSVSEDKATPPKPVPQTRFFKLACIDNGLAFPFKHPNEFRSYPFSWSAYFPDYANRPFNEELKNNILNVLSNIDSFRNVCILVREQLNKDKRYKKKTTIEAQLSVMRGQLLNLKNSLESGKTPADLELEPAVYLKERKRPKKRKQKAQKQQKEAAAGTVAEVPPPPPEPTTSAEDHKHEDPRLGDWNQYFILEDHTVNPYFSCC